MKKINLSKTDAIMNVGTMAVLANGTRSTAQKIAEFARRPVYWGNELIGEEWATNGTPSPKKEYKLGLAFQNQG